MKKKGEHADITSILRNHGHDIGAARIEDRTPKNFRLCKKKDGTLVLQGCFTWTEGTTHGHEWRDLDTVEEE